MESSQGAWLCLEEVRLHIAWMNLETYRCAADAADRERYRDALKTHIARVCAWQQALAAYERAHGVLELRNLSML